MVSAINRTLKELDVDDGIELKRGVEDELAFDKGINNMVTADGLLRILVLLSEGKAFSPALSRRMMDILHGQEFNQGIPARLPKGARRVFVMHDVEGFKHEEIAQHLGISAGTSKAQLHRARMMLRRHLTR